MKQGIKICLVLLVSLLLVSGCKEREEKEVDYLFEGEIRLADFTNVETGVILNVTNITGDVSCISPSLTVYSDGTYEYYNTYITGGGKVNTMALVYGDAITGMYDYELLKIFKNIKEEKEVDAMGFTIRDGYGAEYITDETNEYLMEFFQEIDVDITSCAEAIVISGKN